jgi:hypothetical protein
VWLLLHLSCGETQWAFALAQSNYGLLLLLAVVNAFALLLSADIHLVNFHDPAELWYRAFGHCFTDAVIQIPRGFVSADPQVALQLLCTDPLFCIQPERDCLKPQATKHKFTYDWGDSAPASRRIAGKLIDSQPNKGGTPLWNLLHRVDMPISGANLSLQDPSTGAAYTTMSDATGFFAFDLIPPGTYVLHIEGGGAGDRGYDATDVLIELNPKASRYELVLTRREAGGGSCGGTSLELKNAN